MPNQFSAKPETGPLLASWEGWELYGRASWEGGGWVNFALVAPASETRKRKYYGGWNGLRLAHSTDMGILQKHRPEIYAWLEAWLREYEARMDDGETDG
jgi:hypothetical protein